MSADVDKLLSGDSARRRLPAMRAMTDQLVAAMIKPAQNFPEFAADIATAVAGVALVDSVADEITRRFGPGVAYEIMQRAADRVLTKNGVL